MPRPRFLRLPEEKKKRILEIAAHEFASHGFNGASLNHILSECGVSKGAAYYYFDNKADLFGTVVQHFFEHVTADAGFDPARLTRDTFWPMVREVYMQSLAHTREDGWTTDLAKSVGKLTPVERHSADFAAALEKPMAWLRDLVRRGQQCGAVRTDLPEELLCDLVIGFDEVSDSWMRDQSARLDQRQLTSLMESLVDTLQRMLESR